MHAISDPFDAAIRLALSVALFTCSSQAATTWNQTWNRTAAIPDNDDLGFSDTRTLNLPEITAIEHVTVDLTFADGWNGDLYAYLVHNEQIAVLLNRAGRSTTAPDGSATVGFQVTLDDTAISDIHTGIPMTGGIVTGTWQPDGRLIDPLLVLATDFRPAMLSVFNGQAASGNWTLFIADQSAGETSTFQSWGLTVTGVPEPQTIALAALASLSLMRRRR